jgi:hypothetical protein
MIFIVAIVGAVLTIHLWIQKERGFNRGCLGLLGTEQRTGCRFKMQKSVQSDAG